LGFEELDVDETSDNSQAMKRMGLPFRESGAPMTVHRSRTMKKPPLPSLGVWQSLGKKEVKEG
jgi:hypothetical protein